ncbi:hypothetical protein SFC66_03750 [Terribacillus saccharophilus]|uniref:hypothetical protein n=1 Tax=Terribacillus saccharophilus TaxID=361277 RepID=UPI003981B9F7
MKKTLLGMLLLLVIVLAACGKPNLEGTWENEDEYGIVTSITFHDDGTAVMKDDFMEEEIEYSFNDDGDQLTLSYEGENMTTGFEQKSKDEIVLTNSDDDTLTFKKQ